MRILCRGISFDKLGQFEQVSVDLLQLLAMSAHVMYLSCYLDIDAQCLQAVADFTTVLKLDPNNVNAYFNRGSAYDSLGQYEKAVADYTHALDLDSSSTNPETLLGKLAAFQEAILQSCLYVPLIALRCTAW